MKKSVKEKIKILPTLPGIYLFKNRLQEILYIGKAKNIRARVRGHFVTHRSNKRNNKIPSTIVPYGAIADIDYITTKTENDALILESILIKRHQPKYNVELKDDKNFLFVVISNESYPRITTTHQPKIAPGNIIGPFVSSKEAKQLLMSARTLFPYKTCTSSIHKPCLYYHLGLCNAHLEKARTYHLVIAALKTLLYLYAGNIRIRQPYAPAPVTPRIECYDISNTQGSHSVGSCVVFNGSKSNKGAYRKFRIKTVSGANDPQSLREVIQRRLAHTEWPYPDLIVIDGGKGQLSALKDIPLPIVALAKAKQHKRSITNKIETKRLATKGMLYSPWAKRGVALSAFPKEIAQLFLAIRDEAHRFAITYHRQRTQKMLIVRPHRTSRETSDRISHLQ
ncbi:MAG: GIY-YIG nuclease family protein [Candidatus Pacebacteria bacterium]|nr:GIY-YIG nuclease family protein [Candidatus Paceibacterota bacterium]